MTHPIDLHVGKRLKLRRALLGISQEQAGMAVGVTFQQIQKYERGQDRISASRLYDLAQLLRVSVTYFYEGIDDQAQVPVLNKEEERERMQMASRETLELVRGYYRIADAIVRKQVTALIKALEGKGAA